MDYIISKLSEVVWGTPTLLLIVFTGILMSVGNGFFQFVNFRHWLKESLGCFLSRKKHEGSDSKNNGHISQFQAICTVLAATVGNGNISGVATAIAVGGPGAVFWMWISAFIGMMTAYSENVLGMCYRKKDASGNWCGGPMYYLRDGVGKIKNCKTLGKILAVIFSLFCLIASFGIGNMTQVNSVSSALKTNFGVSELKCGIVLAILTAIIIIGGVKRIGKFTEKFVPLMSLMYIIIAFFVLVYNFKQIPYVFYSIFSNAFDFAPIAGAGSGIAIKKAVNYGFRRGVFSNEAGLGSTVIINSTSDAATPVKQGILGIFEVFFDTIIVCSLTAFILLSSSGSSMSVEDALTNITHDEQYACISDYASEFDSDTLLIGTKANPVPENASAIKPSKKFRVTPKNARSFDISLKNSNKDFVYTNVMSIRGVTVDSNGKILDGNHEPINGVVFEKVDGISLVTYALSQNFGIWAGKLLAIASIMFAISTIIGWSYYGIKSWEFLFGEKTLIIYKIVFILFIVIGASISLERVWIISDIFNGLMSIPNLIGVILLSGTVFKITGKYRKDVLGKKYF